MDKHLSIVLKTVKRSAGLDTIPNCDQVIERLIGLLESFHQDGDQENRIAVACGLKALSYLQWLDDPAIPVGGQFRPGSF